MATKRQKKKAIKQVKKVSKSHPILIIVLLIIIAGLVVAGILLYRNGYFDKWFKKDNQTQSNSGDLKEDGVVENIVYDNFQIHFMELGNKYTGDSTYIKAGDIDILIDAGSRGESAKTINEYVKKYCTDGKLEYVISTHAHQDHIAGFAGVSDLKAKNYKGNVVGKTGVLYYYEVGTLIDFAYRGKKSEAVDNKNAKSADYASNSEYGKYLAAREYAIANGTTYYTAKELWDSKNTTLTLADGITMDILYNYFYFNTSNDENNYSVCTMFNYNDKHFMLTGDLELEGEEKLAEYYDNSTPAKTLPHCDLFKAGHHGSKTSSNECLLSKISPNICCVCCCAGATEYTADYSTQFPTQDFINRIAKYTDRVYVTSVFNEETLTNESLNGNIIVSFNGTNLGLSATNNLTKLKDSSWFNADIYIDSSKNNVSGKGKEDFFTKDTPNVTKVKRRIWPTKGAS
ncbi:MAG: MBL fold metallo-hydrolase [Acholeplasmatales bacterium]|nr:MBL fold metallo-hydrolase [Acholeplasmatales bacterium]